MLRRLETWLHGPTPGWPERTPLVRLPGGETVTLRPLRLQDGREWRRTRVLDQQWLQPVEPTIRSTWEAAHTKNAWVGQWTMLKEMASDGTVVPMVIEVDGRFAGQLTLGGIQRGTVDECWIGYWVHSPYQGRGIATAACALGTDHAINRVGLHRVTATYLPDNPASGRVLEAVGFREEGFMRGNIHINGRWRDHYFVAMTEDDYPTSAVDRLRRSGRIR
ncbi:GNAT family N-acetyltransferase [Corynebacterium sp. NML140438]|nr:GNAT family protein [Corynebacterium sp. NML140438]OIR41645.1 GNAT family N-acetyltransferase [Corynebacterium sp. NML140438]